MVLRKFVFFLYFEQRKETNLFEGSLTVPETWLLESRVGQVIVYKVTSHINSCSTMI